MVVNYFSGGRYDQNLSSNRRFLRALESLVLCFVLPKSSLNSALNVLKDGIVLAFVLRHSTAEILGKTWVKIS